VDVQSLARRIAGRVRRAWWHREGPAQEEAERPPSVLLQARTVAEVRARELLLRLLTPAQREEFRLHGYFAVQVARRGKFWILPSTIFNVLHAETGACYCAAPRAEVPLSDLMLAQKLLLENSPEVFFAVANRRAELIPGLVDGRLRPDRVMQARRISPRTRVRCSEVSMIPHGNHLA
jgi:hypothetical protein